MKRLLLVIPTVLVAVAMLGAFASPANAGSGVLRVACPFSNSLQVDPIVSPGVFPSAHLHDFYGNTGITQNTTDANIGNTSGNCKNEPMNHSGYWVPSLFLAGKPHPARVVAVYYSRFPGGVARETVPHGLQMLAGKHDATGPQSVDVVKWDCLQAPTAPNQDHPYDCSPFHKNDGSPATVQATVRFPSCWSGKDLLPTSLAYAGKNGTLCPAGFPHLIPSIRITLQTDVVNPLYPDGSPMLSFSSGPFYTLHGDVFEGWVQSRIDLLLHQSGVTA